MHACLGSQQGHTERSGAPPAPIRVPTPAIAVQPGTAAARNSYAPAPPPVPNPRPGTVSSCDSGGCWDSEGHRLNFMGPMLIGPQGLCTLQGQSVHCPQ
jgi:hypothetical protein